MEPAGVFLKLVPFSLTPKFVDEIIEDDFKIVHIINYQMQIFKLV